MSVYPYGCVFGFLDIKGFRCLRYSNGAQCGIDETTIDRVLLRASDAIIVGSYGFANSLGRGVVDSPGFGGVRLSCSHATVRQYKHESH